MYNERKLLDKGFIKLVGILGDDTTSTKAYGRKVNDLDHLKKTIVNFMVGKRCTFEHATMQFHIKCPLFLKEEWLKHRWASFTEIKYNNSKLEFYIPSHFIKHDVSGPKKMSEEECNELSLKFQNFYSWTTNFYNKLTYKYSLVRGQARFTFPEGRYVEFYWTVNLRSLMNFIKFHLNNTNAEEMYKYSDILLDFFSQNFPITAESFITQDMGNRRIS